MEQLAMLLAERLVALDPTATTRILWETAKLHRGSTSPLERQQLLDFQTRFCALVGRPAVALEASRDEGRDEQQEAALQTARSVPGLLS